MNKFSYPVKLNPDESGGFVVTFRDLPEAITQGETVDESLLEAQDCLAEAIARRMSDGQEIPQASELDVSEYLVTVPMQIAMKAALYLALRETNMANTQLGELIGKDEKEVRRMLDPHHRTRIGTIEQALRMLGKQPELRVL
jgi:antitoxin HicB